MNEEDTNQQTKESAPMQAYEKLRCPTQQQLLPAQSAQPGL